MFFFKRIAVSLIITIMAALAVGLFGAIRVQAQGGVLSYGQVVSGNLTEQNPLAIYAFQGVEGQLIAAQVIGIPPAMKPTLSLLSPSGQPIANSAEQAYLFSTDAQVSARLPQSGLYSLVINDAGGAVGQFILRLALRGEGTLPVLPANTPTPVELSAEAPSQAYRLQADALNPTQLSVTTLDGALFGVEVLSSSGRSLAQVDGLSEVNVKLPAAEYFYLILTRLQPSTGNILIVSISGAGVAAPVVPPPPPIIPPPPTVQAPSGSTGTCQAFANGTVNVRAGPGTQYATLTQLSAGQSVVITGVNSNWYAASIPNVGTGWLSGSVVTLQGACGSLPFTPFTASGGPATATPLTALTATPTSLVVATATPPTGIEPTATLMGIPPTATFIPPTETPPPPTATYTVVPVQTAPPDANFNSALTIPLDGTATSSDYVSYPLGDREDRVRFSVSGMNPNTAMSGGRARLIIVVTCSGTGTQHVQFTSGTRTVGCGSTIVDRIVTADSDTGTVIILATGGEGTYVQWTLTGSATREN
ncbi:MAG: hypothetical protein DYG88_05185 [Chloroflexi bacterium CFX4]|nr:hypothetical protein [Chloroflexi bacterium CFX4]MDL1924028.1 hypothetical protein [Chloroflexi bacterium CFX3]